MSERKQGTTGIAVAKFTLYGVAFRDGTVADIEVSADLMRLANVKAAKATFSSRKKIKMGDNSITIRAINVEGAKS